MAEDEAQYEQAIAQALELLGEFFEAVEILATREEDKGTRTIKRGIGNWHARQGMAHEFINGAKAEQIAYELNVRPDDEEE